MSGEQWWTDEDAERVLLRTAECDLAQTPDCDAETGNVLWECAYHVHAERSQRDDYCPEAEAIAHSILAALAPTIERVRREAKAEALREAVAAFAITIPDALGYKVRAVAVEDLLDRADEIDHGSES